MTTFFYQPGPAGSGKTRQLAHWAVERAAKNQKVLIAQPTKELIRETAAQIRKLNPEIVMKPLYGVRTNDRVTSRVLEYMTNSAPHHGDVLLVTHETLKRLPPNMRTHWHMVCDEVPAVLEHIDLRIAKTHRIVTDHIDASDEIAPGLLALKVGNRAGLENVAANPSEDQNVGSFNRLVASLLADDQQVFMTTDQWNDLTGNPNHTGHVDFFSVLLPEFVKEYASTTFMGANIQETEMFVIWSAIQNINWQLHPELGSKLRYQTHENGSRLTIGYLFDGRLSKRFLGNEDEEGNTVFDDVANYVSRYYANTPFLWQANKDAMPAGFDFTMRLPGVAHGLDKQAWKQVHNVALLSAVNRKSAAYGFLHRLGISSEQAQATLSYQNDYQAMMRCSLRDPDAIADVRVIVGSKDGAEWIKARFPDASVVALDHGIAQPKASGRPTGSTRGGLTSTERSQKRRAEKKAAQAAIDARIMAASKSGK